MPDKLNEDYIEFEFSFDGVDYCGRAYPDYDSPDDPPLQVTFYRTATPGEQKICFLRQVEPGVWEQAATSAQLSDGFVKAIGKAIERAGE